MCRIIYIWCEGRKLENNHPTWMQSQEGMNITPKMTSHMTFMTFIMTLVTDHMTQG